MEDFTNGDFETGTIVPWGYGYVSSYARPLVVTGTVSSGTYSCITHCDLSLESEPYGASAINQDIDLTDVENIYFNLYIEEFEESDGDDASFLIYGQKGGDMPDIFYQESGTTGGWVSRSATVPASYQTANVKVYFLSQVWQGE